MGSDLPAQPESGLEERDPTGRSRMAWNVLASWVGHTVFIVAGFIMPRFIDRRIGQEALGVWDFAWSLVGYFGLVELGVGSSVGRYVAKHRASQETEALNQAVSNALVLQSVAAGLVLILTAGFSMVLPWLFGSRLGDRAADAQAVVAFLGVSLALQLAFDVFNGVITGCHRWDLHNAINAGFYALIATAMIVAVARGGGLRSLAIVNCVGVAVTEVARRAVAHRVCPELRIRFRDVDRSGLRRLIGFGAKTSLDGLGAQLLSQGNSIVIASLLGPASLAVYSRSVALVRHVENLVNKFAHVLTPTASSLQAQGQNEKLRSLLVESGRIGSCLTFPMALGLAIQGTPLLRLWMGPRYEHGVVLAILALGSCLAISQRPAMTILTGLNLHGRMGVANLVLALLGLVFSAAALGVWGWGLPGAALGLVLPRLVGRGLLIPAFACRRLGVPLALYTYRVAVAPAVYVLPFALALAVVRVLLGEQPLAALVCSTVAGGLALAPVYWFRVLSPDQRRSVGAITARYLGTRPLPPTI